MEALSSRDLQYRSLDDHLRNSGCEMVDWTTWAWHWGIWVYPVTNLTWIYILKPMHAWKCQHRQKCTVVLFSVCVNLWHLGTVRETRGERWILNIKYRNHPRGKPLRLMTLTLRDRYSNQISWMTSPHVHVSNKDFVWHGTYIRT